MKQNLYLRSLLFLLFFTFIFSPLNAATDFKAKKNPPNVKEGKTKGYNGDPALKRGYDLGYDDGIKAGKGDKKIGKKDQPTVHESYKTPEKKFRHEYGSQSKFITGYRAGFSRGYKVGFAQGKKDPNEARKFAEDKNAKKKADKDKAEDKNRKAALTTPTKHSEETSTPKREITSDVSNPSVTEKPAVDKTAKYNPSEDAL